MLDDTEDADVLVHLLPSIHFIQAELDKGRGVLVHCQAGTLVSIGQSSSLWLCSVQCIGRSSTIVAACLMYSRDLDTSSALELMKKACPNIEHDDLVKFCSGQIKTSCNSLKSFIKQNIR